MSTYLEEIRLIHEDIETLKHLATAALQSRGDPSNPHSRIKDTNINLNTVATSEKLAADLIHETKYRSEGLLRLYSATSEPMKNEDPFSTFYSRLRDIREAHRTREAERDLVETQTERDVALLKAANKPAEFSGEEGGGRFLDLTSHFTNFVNIAQANPSPPYYEYVRESITNFDLVKDSVRNKRSFKEYLINLQTYLEDFANRTHPLDIVGSLIRQFKEKEKKRIEESLLEISELPSAEHVLEKCLMKGVTQRLRDLGLKSGGKPKERAVRLWEAAQKIQYSERVILEPLIMFTLGQVLCEERAATVANIEKKLSLSYAEMEAERIADEALQTGREEIKEDDEDLEQTIYNPKDVPLGWDGRPIPYWMYKLHGLNHVFKCEICGNASYKGPRAFEKHFTESAHVQGLRRLGIGYSKVFMMITEIKDALSLQERIGKTKQEVSFDEENEVEFEDDEGNVMNKKTYTDLKRQGLL